MLSILHRFLDIVDHSICLFVGRGTGYTLENIDSDHRTVNQDGTSLSGCPM